MKISMADNSNIRDNLKILLEGIRNSYSQVFFSDKPAFGIMLIIISFLVPVSGLSGLLGVVSSIIIARLLNLDRIGIAKGIYSYNTLLATLPLGMFFEPGWVLWLVVILTSLLVLMVTIATRGVLMKYGLPFLSIPFLIGLWSVILATRQFSLLETSDYGIYTLNQLYQVGGFGWVKLHNWFDQIPIFPAWRTYFLSMGAIFFQYSVLAGVLISIGILVYSRIAFILSILGFFTAYLFYRIIGLEISTLDYLYIGFNYILTAIAIGGFYLVPSYRSFLWSAVLIPLVVIITVAAGALFRMWDLSVYALPFNIVVILFLYVLKFREKQGRHMQEVVVQHNSPEKNLYAYQNYKYRFAPQTSVHFILPFWGEWKVSQGHSGEHTHRDDWRYAWDFVITDNKGKQSKEGAIKPQDYHCYGKTVLAPASGIIEDVVEGIPDNEIGKMNLANNWGNTIVIRHLDNVFSKLSHLRPGSIKVRKGSYVERGQAIAECGNSGRSPEPHLHFQVQETPHIGSSTKEYPISYYLVREENRSRFETFSIPAEGEQLSGLEINTLLFKALNWIPGQRFNYAFTDGDKTEKLEFEVRSTSFNETYLYCKKYNARAFFKHDGQVFYFTHYSGPSYSPLKFLYLSLYKVPLIFIQNLQIRDTLPVNQAFGGGVALVQDFLAPFVQVLEGGFTLGYDSIDDELDPEEIRLKSSLARKAFYQDEPWWDFILHIKEGGLVFLEGNYKNRKIELKWE
jgi:urea transporter